MEFILEENEEKNDSNMNWTYNNDNDNVVDVVDDDDTFVLGEFSRRRREINLDLRLSNIKYGFKMLMSIIIVYFNIDIILLTSPDVDITANKQ